MQEKLNKPKRFGEILDTIFTLSRNYFIEFIKIFFIIIGPIYILQAVIQLMTGVSFFRDVSFGANWLEGVIDSLEQDDVLLEGFDTILFISLFALLFTIVAQVAVLYAVDHIRRGEQFMVNDLVKRAFSRFFPLIGGAIILALIFFVSFIIIFIVAFLIGVAVSVVSPVLTVLLLIPLIIGVFILIAFLAVKFSFYAGKVAFGEGVFASLGASWNLTKGRFWVILGIYVIFSIILGVITTMFEAIFGIVLGNSVLYGLILNTVTLVVTMITAVGYSVVYLDLHVRHDSEDLKDMISQYDEQIE